MLRYLALLTAFRDPSPLEQERPARFGSGRGTMGEGLTRGKGGEGPASRPHRADWD